MTGLKGCECEGTGLKREYVNNQKILFRVTDKPCWCVPHAERIQELTSKANTFDAFVQSVLALEPHVETEEPDPIVETLLDKVKDNMQMRERIQRLEAALKPCIDLLGRAALKFDHGAIYHAMMDAQRDVIQALEIREAARVLEGK